MLYMYSSQKTAASNDNSNWIQQVSERQYWDIIALLALIKKKNQNKYKTNLNMLEYSNRKLSYHMHRSSNWSQKIPQPGGSVSR